MRTVTLYDGTPVPVMGLGTWAMGGRSRPNPSQDQRALQALRGLDRQRFFLTTKVRPHSTRINRWSQL